VGDVGAWIYGTRLYSVPPERQGSNGNDVGLIISVFLTQKGRREAAFFVALGAIAPFCDILRVGAILLAVSRPSPVIGSIVTWRALADRRPSDPKAGDASPPPLRLQQHGQLARHADWRLPAE
jgi:hypothetical protein